MQFNPSSAFNWKWSNLDCRIKVGASTKGSAKGARRQRKEFSPYAVVHSALRDPELFCMFHKWWILAVKFSLGSYGYCAVWFTSGLKKPAFDIPVTLIFGPTIL